MIESFNQILFCITVLFGVQVPIISDNTSLFIDTNTNTIDIYYSDLQIYEEYSNYNDLAIGYLDSLNSFDVEFADFTLISSDKKLKNKGFDYELRLKYKSLDSVKEYFKIDLDSFKIYVFDGDIYKINNTDSLSTDNTFGEYMGFEKRMDNKYNIQYDWDKEKLQIKMVSLIKNKKD
jgi:hypothetical protein